MSTADNGDVLLLIFTSDPLCEKRLHRKFAADKVSGDYFMYSHAIQDFIEDTLIRSRDGVSVMKSRSIKVSRCDQEVIDDILCRRERCGRKIACIANVDNTVREVALKNNVSVDTAWSIIVDFWLDTQVQLRGL